MATTVTSRPWRLTSATPSGNGVLLLRHRAFDAPLGQHLILEEHYRVIVPDGALHQSFSVIRRTGHNQLQARQVHEQRMGTLRVLRCGRAATASGGAKHDGEGCLPAEHVVDLRHLVDDLVHGGEGKGHHPWADDRAEAATRRADAGADVGFLGDGADADALLAKLRDEACQCPQAAAEVEHLLIPPHLLAKGFHQGFRIGDLSHAFMSSPSPPEPSPVARDGEGAA